MKSVPHQFGIEYPVSTLGADKVLRQVARRYFALAANFAPLPVDPQQYLNNVERLQVHLLDWGVFKRT